MYNNVYESMVDAGVAVKLDAAAWFNKDGNEAPTEENSVGRQSSYKLTHPDLVLFMDEVGDNTSQNNDGNVGGQKLLVDPKCQAVCHQHLQIAILLFSDLLMG